MMRIMYRQANSAVDSSLSPGQIPATLADPSGLLWVDFLDETDASCERILLDVFRFHPLAVDDALRESLVPKLDDWDTYLYLVLHAITFDPGAEKQLRTMELDISLKKNYLMTHHEQTIEPRERVWAGCPRDQRVMGRGAARLLYHLIDEVVAEHMPAVDAIDEEMERVEELILFSQGALEKGSPGSPGGSTILSANGICL